jgi:NAD(P)-dependent dehydrogenase (short-subunit alcohol dehydrogenase family)
VTAHRGSVALVTGGARGLGVEICRQLAQAGIIVWCTARTIEHAESTAEQLRRAGDVRAARLDVTDADSVRALADRLDRLDILVNNAAIDYDTDASALSVDLARVDRGWRWRRTAAGPPTASSPSKAPSPSQSRRSAQTNTRASASCASTRAASGRRRSPSSPDMRSGLSSTSIRGWLHEILPLEGVYAGESFRHPGSFSSSWTWLPMSTPFSAA